MGEVYVATQQSLDRTVALKFLMFSPRADPVEQVKRFRREAELMAKIVHPNIVSVFDSGEVDGRPFLVMEYVEGNDLRQYMAEGQPMALDRVRRLVSAFAEALACLHANGVMHRDFKPENILIGTNFTPKVTDFGIAVEYAAAGVLTLTDRWFGTIGYVAPEQQYRLKVDARADQYSMAAVTYELLTGQKPLGVFKPPSLLNRSLNRRVDAVLMKGLQEDREDRYPSVVMFATALEAALSPKPRRWRGLAAALTAIAALLAVGLCVAWLVSAFMIRTWTNSIGMTFVRIPTGACVIGSPDTDPLAKPNEKPAHLVKIDHPFYLGTHEVTVGQFAQFVKETRARTEAELHGQGGHLFDDTRSIIRQSAAYIWSHPGDGEPAENDEAVTQVTWNDAVRFCKWLSDKEHFRYRLPTEAEWEYACRAGTATRWSMGDDPSQLNAHAWTFTNASETQAVGRKRPNLFGLYDMHGNVWEWCVDRYAPYSADAAVNAKEPGAGVERVLRGGSWDWDDPGVSRSASRLDARPDFANYTYGFRVCIDTQSSRHD